MNTIFTVINGVILKVPILNVVLFHHVGQNQSLENVVVQEDLKFTTLMKMVNGVSIITNGVVLKKMLFKRPLPPPPLPELQLELPLELPPPPQIQHQLVHNNSNNVVVSTLVVQIVVSVI